MVLGSCSLFELKVSDLTDFEKRAEIENEDFEEECEAEGYMDISCKKISDSVEVLTVYNSEGYEVIDITAHREDDATVLIIKVRYCDKKAAIRCNEKPKVEIDRTAVRAECGNAVLLWL